jgi:hypothetical protein
MSADILFEQNPLGGVWQLFPFVITAKMVAIMTFELVTVYTVYSTDSFAAYRQIIYISLLKKTRIHAS